MKENKFYIIYDLQDYSNHWETDIHGIREFIRDTWQDDEDMTDTEWNKILTEDIKTLTDRLNGIEYDLLDHEFYVLCDSCNNWVDQLKGEDIYLEDENTVLCVECHDKKKSIFTVIITETLVKEVYVTAKNKEEALQIVQEEWETGKHVLEYDDFNDVNFRIDD